MDTFVEESLLWDHLDESELPELAELRAAVEYFDDPVQRFGLAEFAARFHAFDAHPELNTVRGRDRVGGNIVAYGWNHNDPTEQIPRVVMSGDVHPAWRDQRIGWALVAWQLERAREWAAALPHAPDEVWVGAYADESQVSACRLFETVGMHAKRYFCDLHHIFARVPNPPPPPPVDGVAFEPYTDDDSEAVRRLHNRAFASNEGFSPVAVEEWLAMQSRPEFRPEWSWVARSAGELVGYALNSADEQAWADQGFTEGWTDRLGVDPDHRRRGVARGLLSWSMWSFGRAGLEGAGLGIDTDDAEATLRLYRSIGYESQEAVVLFSATMPVAVA